MSIANSAPCETPGRQAYVPAAAVRPDVGPMWYQGTLDDPLPATLPYLGRAAGWCAREEGEYYIPNPMEDEEYDPDPMLLDAADAQTEQQREAMALLDDAENLLAVLLASIEQDSDSRAMQAEAVLKAVRKKLRKAHTRIDRQDARHRNLFLAYFDLRSRFQSDTRS